MAKPDALFDRDQEWSALERFVDSEFAGSTLGLVYGRRRQGKTYLLQTLTEHCGGFYFVALRQSSTQNLQRLAEAYRLYTGTRARVHFQTWEEALEALLAIGDGATEPAVVVIDEFPYLLEAAPQIPSLLQALLSPRGEAVTKWHTRLVLCGSALSTMRSLLAGTAPLRGRASLDLMVHPFGFRDAAAFWKVDHDPDVAMRLHALVGGTPAYLDMCGRRRPNSAELFDAWVVSALLDPASAMFREGNVLLAEEDRITDTAPYLSVLAAISSGAHRRGEIAQAVGRPPTALGHPLGVLTEARLIQPLQDALKDRRASFQVSEPVIRLGELVISPNEGRLSRHQGAEVWAQARGTVSSKIYGPHFETLARQWCAEHAASTTVGGTADQVGPTEVNCRLHRKNHELDVVVVEKVANKGNRVVSIGEAKWRAAACGSGQLNRLEHIRDVLALPDARLLLFSRTGFTAELASAASKRSDVELIDTARLYGGD